MGDIASLRVSLPRQWQPIIQSVIGALAAIGVTLKLYWHKIKLKLGGHKPAELDSELTENSSTRE